MVRGPPTTSAGKMRILLTLSPGLAALGFEKAGDGETEACVKTP